VYEPYSHWAGVCSQKAVKEQPLMEQAFVRALNKAVDGDFAERMIKNIRDGLDSVRSRFELRSMTSPCVRIRLFLGFAYGSVG